MGGLAWFATRVLSSRLPQAAVLSMALVHPAAAESVAGTMEQWGLLGDWSFDCSLPADRNKGTVFSYEPADDGTVTHYRDFGDVKDKAEVSSARMSDDGLIHLRIYFPAIRQTREFGLAHTADGSIRAIYNRDDKNQYSIRDGKFTQTGKPTPPLQRCDPSP